MPRPLKLYHAAALQAGLRFRKNRLLNGYIDCANVTIDGSSGKSVKMSVKRKFYADDLAYIHDAGFASFANGSAPGLLDILREAGVVNGLVVDLGCGSGIWAKHLVDAGFVVAGIDVSPAMISLARWQVPTADFTVGSLWKYRFVRCRAVTALGEVVCYRPEGKTQKLESILRKVFQCLEPGGLFIFDVIETSIDRNCKTSIAEGTDWSCIVAIDFDEKRERIVRHIRSFRKVGDLYRRSSERHDLQLYRRGEVAKSLRRAGFRVQTVQKFGKYRLLPGRIGFIARKPAS